MTKQPRKMARFFIYIDDKTKVPWTALGSFQNAHDYATRTLQRFEWVIRDHETQGYPIVGRK